MSKKRTVYIAGPMRGYPGYNFDAFHRAEAVLKSKGFGVISPARMDEKKGFDPTAYPQYEAIPYKVVLEIIHRDLNAILNLRPGKDALVVLKGWKKSKGATAEVAVARWMGLAVLKYPSLEVI